MKKNNIADALNTINNTKDIMPLLLFILYKLKDDPQYTVLSELAFILDNDNFFKFLDYYEGVTIKVPLKSEYQALLPALKLFQYTKRDGMELKEALKLLNKSPSELTAIKETYYKILEITKDYDFKGVTNE